MELEMAQLLGMAQLLVNDGAARRQVWLTMVEYCG